MVVFQKPKFSKNRERSLRVDSFAIDRSVFYQKQKKLEKEQKNNPARNFAGFISEKIEFFKS